MKPYLVATGAISFLATPTELVLPVVRLLRGHSGVATGPALVTLVHGVIGMGVVHAVRRDPRRVARLRDAKPSRWLLALPLYLLVSPALASERFVVLRSRSPLWGSVLSPIGGLHVAVALVTLRRALRVKRSAGS